METFRDIENDGRLLYKYTRGSTLYNLNAPDSDLDEGGLYIQSKNSFLGLSEVGFKGQVSDERNDTTWYEVGKFCDMLLSSNPTVLEALFTPEDKQLLKPNKVLTPLFENRDLFITKDCFKPFVQYAIEQIRKARGLNKKIVNPINERKWPLEFCYTFRKQGSTNVTYWLEYRNLKQEYCGLVNIPNMHDIYGVYYDWGKYFEDEGITGEDLVKYYYYPKEYWDTAKIVKLLKEAKSEKEKSNYEKMLKRCYQYNIAHFIVDFYGFSDGVDELLMKFAKQNPIGYRGIVSPKSNELRLSSVSKGEMPICYISFNQQGYTKHCIEYNEYQKWVKFRNPKRYESNLNKNYDSKNMMHCVRLITMGQELAEGKGLILDRRIAGDRDFLMGIRNHKFEYDELMAIVTEKETKMKEAIAKSTLAEHINKDLINDILIDIRKNMYKMQ